MKPYEPAYMLKTKQKRLADLSKRKAMESIVDGMIDSMFMDCIGVSRGNRLKEQNIVVELIKESIQAVNDMQYEEFVFSQAARMTQKRIIKTVTKKLVTEII